MNIDFSAQPCGNFGHNFFRIKGLNGRSDTVKCKHCDLEINLDQNGNIREDKFDKAKVHELLKKLFVLRTSSMIRPKHRVFGI